MAERQDSNISRGKVVRGGGEPIEGPVTQKHRMRLGEADGVNDPNGVGNPSTQSTIANAKKNW